MTPPETQPRKRPRALRATVRIVEGLARAAAPTTIAAALVACAAVSPASAPAPAPDPAPAPVRAPASVTEASDPPPAEAPELALLRRVGGGPVVGWVSDRAALRDARPLENRLVFETRFFLPEHPGGNHYKALELELSAAAAEQLRAPDPDPALYTAYHHELELFDDEGAFLAESGCLEIEVLEQGDDQTRVRVGRDGVVLEGWVRGPVSRRGPADCPARSLPRGPAYATVLIDGVPVERPEPEPLPPGYLPAADELDPIPTRGALWWMVGDEDTPPAQRCQRWQWARDPRRPSLQRAEGTVRHGYDVQVESGGALVLLGPWRRDADPRGSSGAMGCVQRMVPVKATPEAWTLIDAPAGVSAYHEDDAVRWYRSAEACAAAAAAGAPARSGC